MHPFEQFSHMLMPFGFIFQSALGHDYNEKVEKHASQKDYTSGFGGKYGVQVDRVDNSAVGWDYKHKPEKHESQKGTLLHTNHRHKLCCLRS